MTATNHALTGALIAATVKVPELAIPLAFLAHFAMDAVPHFGVSEPDVFKQHQSRKFIGILAGDMLVAATLLLSLPFLLHAVIPLWLTFLSMLACMSPDLVWGWHFYFEVRYKQTKQKRWFSKFHSWIQWSQVEKGAYIEMIWFVVGLYCIVLTRSS